MITKIKERILSGGEITHEEALALLNTPDKDELYEAAHEITEHFMGDSFDTCSIINAKSGNCPEDCKWCAQSGHYATSAEKYALVSPSVSVAQATYNHKQGIGRFSLVASGRRSSDKEIDLLSISYRAIKKANPSLKCCASLGLLREDQLRKLFESGVTTYHCNMETAPSHFANLCTTHTQQDKEETLEAARRVGMRICSGGIIGMGETAEQRIELAFYLKSLRVESIPFNILQPILGTPLYGTTPLTEEEILTAIALFRLINPRSFLRFSGGRAQLSAELQRKAIYVGVNSAITGDLLTTIGQQAKDDMAMIEECGKVNRSVDWEVSYDF
ncbi:biotin synthase BioB [Porphyromonas sp. COT-239 OH1446]|uniref:biotin synthase BioB n=1 Tax=Porphyromonas sp. COT-239 OH1446 TaxID=1515613 RepID=UPI00052CDCFB|nr:biotin synthase BioB [Porphyromonas sp. COT-239 OH1446]KGN70016.1 biotin synthase [Porphyromonas sp. COT-239 OH1446]